MKNEKNEIRKKVKARVKEEQAQIEAPKKEEKIPHSFVLNCLNANELGDGMLFAAIHTDKFLFCATFGEWLFWENHFWSRDLTGMARFAMENVCAVYSAASAKELSEARKGAEAGRKDMADFHGKTEKRLLDRVKKLRSRRGRDNALNFASLYAPVKSEKFDQDPWLLACKNGVINLKSGKFSPGRPEQFLSMAAPVEWAGIDAQAPLWEKTLLEIFNGSKEVVDFLQRLFGYGITGIISEHIFPVLWGQGRNGKTLILETLQHCLGPLVVTLNPETLLDQGRARNPAAPSPDVMAIKGARIAITSETDDGRRLAVSALKRATGGDTLVARNPHDKYETRFSPSHLLLLSTNNRPQTGNDFALWERLRLVFFPLSFVDRRPHAENERRAVKGLIQKLYKESAGILAWLVMGCLLWQRHGLDTPACILQATAEYRKTEDIFGDFLEENCELSSEPGVETPASDLWDTFDEWYKINVSKRGLSRRKFGMMMRDRGFKKEKRGRILYHGIQLKNR